jgi:hypothetical protein
VGRTLSTPTATATAKIITQPRYLFQAQFSFTVRYSSGEDVSWNSLDWIAANLRVGALQEQPNGSQALTVVIGNTDLAFGAICLNEPPQDKLVDIWAFYEGALATGDPVKIFSGAIDSCNINESAVTLQLSPLNARTLFIPRRRITRDSGFNHLSPAGRVFPFNGVNYTITRG